MLIRSSQFYNARTERVPVAPGQTEQKLRLLKPNEAVHNLFMSVLCFYASHRDVAMSSKIVATLQALSACPQDRKQQKQLLSQAIECVSSRVPRDAIRNALDEARLSLLAYD